MRNRETKSAVRTAIKKFQVALAAKDAAIAKEKLDVAVKLLDTAGGKGVVPRNAVSRKKSRMYAQFNMLNKAE
jgi:small subunit ribosomal protein S20